MVINWRETVKHLVYVMEGSKETWTYLLGERMESIKRESLNIWEYVVNSVGSGHRVRESEGGGIMRKREIKSTTATYTTDLQEHRWLSDPDIVINSNTRFTLLMLL